jgi:predicted acyl esterase
LEAAAGEESTTWMHDPDTLVPSLDEIPFRDLLGTLPDEALLEDRPDVLTFTSAAMDRPLDLVGPIRQSRCAVTADAPTMQVVAKVVDVYPSGRARRIS